MSLYIIYINYLDVILSICKKLSIKPTFFIYYKKVEIYNYLKDYLNTLCFTMCFLTIIRTNGTTLTFEESSVRVRKLKDLIQERTGISAHEQNIVSGSVLDDTTVVNAQMMPVSLIPGAIGILITVKIGTYVVTVNVPSDSVVSGLLFHLQSHFSYDITHFSLYGNGKELRKDLPVSAIGKVELFLLPPLKSGEMVIFILTLTGRSMPIVVSLDMRIDGLKYRVCAVDGIPAEQQRLIFAGKQLEDRKLLSDYNISKGSVVHLVLILRGGMHHCTSTGEGVSSLNGDSESSLLKIRKNDFVVKHSKGTVFLRVETFCSLVQVKVLLQEKLGIPMENMTLHNDAEQELKNDRSLGYYGIELGATLSLSVA